MSIQEISSNFKHFIETGDKMTAGLLILVGIGSFLLGRLSNDVHIPESTVEGSAMVIHAAPLTPVGGTMTLTASATPLVPVTPAAEGAYVASKSGTKYHLPWCSGAKRILDANKIWFKTKEEAEAAGYTPAANCPGI